MTKNYTMGEVTKSIQGYPTQIWLPTDGRRDIGQRIALIHDRRDGADDEYDEHPEVYMIPGNNSEKLITPCSESYAINGIGNNDEVIKNLAIPNAILWANHGGPCERRGERYERLRGDLMDRVYAALALTGKSIVVPGRKLGKMVDFAGPYDYAFPSSSNEKLVYIPMDPKLLR